LGDDVGVWERGYFEKEQEMCMIWGPLWSCRRIRESRSELWQSRRLHWVNKAHGRGVQEALVDEYWLGSTGF